MKKIIAFILITTISQSVFCQSSAQKLVVFFKDKNNSTFQIDQPEEYLSKAAIARRTRQHIQIDSNDIPVNSNYLDSITETGAIILNHSRWFNSATIFTSDSLVLQKINAFPFVKQLKPVAKYKTGKNNLTSNAFDKSTFIPHTQNSKTCSLTSDFNNNALAVESNYDYGYGYKQISMLGGNYLHDIGYQGQGFTIAVLDAGFWGADTLKAFNSLWKNGQIMGTRDFVEPGGNVFNQATHGMMVLSLMGANVPGKLVGTAPKASFWLIRTEDGGSENPIEEYNWAAGAEFADSIGADVINSSLGYTTFDDSTQNHTYSQMNGKTNPSTIAANIASSKGILVVNSAGNSGTNPWHYISSPADAIDILTVGAVDKNRTYALFSSKGPSFDGRIKPEVCSMGLGAFVANSLGGFSSGNGTSFSSPIMAGVATCLWQAHPFCSNLEIIHAIEMSSHQYMSPDTLMGYGIPNMIIANMILSGVAVTNIENENTFNLFPNPYSNDLYIAFFSVESLAVTIDIYNVDGKLVLSRSDLSRKIGTNTIQLTGLNYLQKGLYSLVLTSGNLRISKKILKQ